MEVEERGAGRGKDGRVKHRTVRVEDELWEAAQEAARWRGDNVSQVVRKSLMGYVRATDRKRREEEAGQGTRAR